MSSFIVLLRRSMLRHQETDFGITLDVSEGISSSCQSQKVRHQERTL